MGRAQPAPHLSNGSQPRSESPNSLLVSLPVGSCSALAAAASTAASSSAWNPSSVLTRVLDLDSSLPRCSASPACPTVSDVAVDTSSEITTKDLEEKEVVENGRDAPANGNANEENGEQEADKKVDEEGGEEVEEEEEDEDEEAEASTDKPVAEDDEDVDADAKKQKTDEDN